MRKFSLRKKFPLVIIPFQSIQEIVEPIDHETVFRRVRRHLKENGRFILTTHNENPVHQKKSGKMAFMGRFILRIPPIFRWWRKRIGIICGTALTFVNAYRKNAVLSCILVSPTTVE